MLPGLRCAMSEDFLEHRLAWNIYVYKHAAMPCNIGKTSPTLVDFGGGTCSGQPENSSKVRTQCTCDHRLQMLASASGVLMSHELLMQQSWVPSWPRNAILQLRNSATGRTVWPVRVAGSNESGDGRNITL